MISKVFTTSGLEVLISFVGFDNGILSLCDRPGLFFLYHSLSICCRTVQSYQFEDIAVSHVLDYIYIQRTHKISHPEKHIIEKIKMATQSRQSIGGRCPKSPCVLEYRKVSCPDLRCQSRCVIKVSEEASTKGKLYLSCVACGRNNQFAILFGTNLMSICVSFLLLMSM